MIICVVLYLARNLISFVLNPFGYMLHLLCICCTLAGAWIPDRHLDLFYDTVDPYSMKLAETYCSRDGVQDTFSATIPDWMYDLNQHVANSVLMRKFTRA